MMNVSWTVEYDLNISAADIKMMTIGARSAMGNGLSLDDAVRASVMDYLMGQEDEIWYTITGEAREEIEAVISQRLKKYVKK